MQNPPIYKSLTFWTLLVGLVMFAVKYYVPAFPLSLANILSLVLFLLGLIGVFPTVRSQGLRGALAGGIATSLAFWQLVAGFVLFVISYFSPTFPFGYDAILGAILYILSFFQITPEFRARGFLNPTPKKK